MQLILINSERDYMKGSDVCLTTETLTKCCALSAYVHEEVPSTRPQVLSPKLLNGFRLNVVLGRLH